MEKHATKSFANLSLFYFTMGLMYVALALLALSPVVIIWVAADWLNTVFSLSDTVFADNPRLYTVLTIIAFAAAITIVIDKLRHRMKAQQKSELEHI